MEFAFEEVIKIGLAVAVGGLLGAEREYRDKAAGFRTLILICVGSALFTTFSIAMGLVGDPARVAAQIVSGVGFLGGGAILHSGPSVRGLTTASTIWLAAALGMGIGAGYYAVALPAAAVILLVLWLFPFIESRIESLRIERTYCFVCSADAADPLEQLFGEFGLSPRRFDRFKSKGAYECKARVAGPPIRHRELTQRLLADERVIELRY